MRNVMVDWRKAAKVGTLMVCALLTACSGGGGGDNGGSTCASSTVSVSIEPGAATVVAGTTQPFVATVTGIANTAVAWSVQEGAGGGTVSSTGVYTAPSAAGTYHVVATSQADSCGSEVVTVTVVAAPVIAVSISPVSPVIVRPGGSQAFFATVTGTANTGVTWTVQGTAGGSISVDGVYTAPLSATDADADQVIATSVVDPTRSAQVLVVISTAQPIVISPTAATVGIGGRVEFTLSASTGGVWSVDGIQFGDPTVGTITPIGVYTAPYQLPTSTTAVTTATVTNSFATGPASVTWISRFLNPETLQVDACVPQCAIDLPNALVAADFNQDGLSDLVTANSGTGTVSVIVSSDESHFAAPYRLQVGNPTSGDPQALVAIDINLDGTPPQDPRVDLVIADTDSSGLAVRTRLGVGDGTFGNERSTGLPSNSNPLSMAVGHFDSNPHWDVAVANYTTNSVDILQGVGDGTFQVINTITAGVSAPLGIAVGFFNNDAFEDLAVANNGDDTVSIFLSNADGTFTLAQSLVLLADSGPSAIAAVRLNGDNYPDLVVTTALNNGLTVILNTADPNPLPFTGMQFNSPAPPITTGSRPVAVATGNFNNDLVRDVVVANQNDSSVTLYLFDPVNDVLVSSETHSVGQLPQALAVGDFNGDGWDDVAVTNSGDDTVSVLRNRGGPTTP